MLKECIFTSFHNVTVKKDSIEMFNKMRNGKGLGGLALGYFLGVVLKKSACR